MIEFETLKRSARPNNFLVCDGTYCHAASADVAPPIFEVAAEAVRDAWCAVAQSQPRTKETARSEDGLHVQHVQRSRLMRFPDTIDAAFVPIRDGAATVVLVYSRSKYGYSDMGVNSARVTSWLDQLTAALA